MAFTAQLFFQFSKIFFPFLLELHLPLGLASPFFLRIVPDFISVSALIHFYFFVTNLYFQ